MKHFSDFSNHWSVISQRTVKKTWLSLGHETWWRQLNATVKTVKKYQAMTCVKINLTTHPAYLWMSTWDVCIFIIWLYCFFLIYKFKHHYWLISLKQGLDPINKIQRKIWLYAGIQPIASVTWPIFASLIGQKSSIE